LSSVAQKQKSPGEVEPATCMHLSYVFGSLFEKKGASKDRALNCISFSNGFHISTVWLKWLLQEDLQLTVKDNLEAFLVLNQNLHVY
jgi:hypothetical protein